MENKTLEQLHEQMLEREQEVYIKHAAIRKLEDEIQAGQQAYVHIRDQYIFIVKSLINSKGLNGTQFQKECISNPAITTFSKQIANANTIEEILALLDDNLSAATEYERLGMIYAVMRKGGSTAAQMQQILLESYRQEVATVRILTT